MARWGGGKKEEERAPPLRKKGRAGLFLGQIILVNLRPAQVLAAVQRHHLSGHGGGGKKKAHGGADFLRGSAASQRRGLPLAGELGIRLAGAGQGRLRGRGRLRRWRNSQP